MLYFVETRNMLYKFAAEIFSLIYVLFIILYLLHVLLFGNVKIFSFFLMIFLTM